MVDIAGALKRFGDVIEDYIYPRESRILDPIVLTSAVTEKSLAGTFAVTPLRMQYIGFRVRSMGTATYLGVGTKGNTSFRLTAVNTYFEYEAPKSGYIDASKIWYIADTADLTFEVTGIQMPTRPGEELR